VLFTQYLEDPLLAQFLAGGTAGTVQWLPPIFWFDVIKSKMQTAPKGHYNGVLDCVKKTYKCEGPSGFFR
jgi:solute carrier family 25 carnitine/acylcarnitine transporter 20/29